MEFRGKVWKTEGRPQWVIEVTSLGVITQGHTKKEALAMLQDAVELGCNILAKQPLILLQ
jgi:predicted RNase H-like HicB family nuclease